MRSVPLFQAGMFWAAKRETRVDRCSGTAVPAKCGRTNGLSGRREP